MKLFNLEDFVANALIIKIEYLNEKYITFKELEKYINEIKYQYSKLGEEINCNLDKSSLESLNNCYYTLFEIKENLILLKKDRTYMDLLSYFKSYLPIEIQRIFYDDKIIKDLINK